jgi:hypothetical protein
MGLLKKELAGWRFRDDLRLGTELRLELSFFSGPGVDSVSCWAISLMFYIKREGGGGDGGGAEERESTRA